MIQYYKFISEDKFYLYDTSTSYLIEISKTIYDILDDFIGGKAVLKIISEHTDIDKNEIEKAVTEIKKFQKEFRILQDSPFDGFLFPTAKKDIEDQLRNNMCHVILNITDDCNFRCIYCKYGDTYEFEKFHAKKHMDNKTAIQSIDFLLNNSHDSEELTVGFYGGEPVLRFDLIKSVVNYILSKTDKRVRFSLTTNGSLIGKRVIEYFIDHSFKLTISIDGPAEIHNRYRKSISGRNTYYKIIKTIKEIKKIDKEYYNKHVGFSVVIAPPFHLYSLYEFFNSEQINNQAPIFANLADYYDTSFYNRFPKSIWKDYKHQKEQLRKIFHDKIKNRVNDNSSLLWSLFGDKAVKLHNRPNGYNGNRLYPLGICTPGVHVTFIDTNGELFICERVGKHLSIGNIHQGFDVEKIAQTINDFVNVITKHGCIECPFVRICPSCYVDARRNNSLSNEKLKASCPSKKQGIKEVLHDYAYITQSYPDLLEKYIS